MDLIDRADVLETFAELYDVFEDNKEIHKKLHKVYDKLRTLTAVQTCEDAVSRQAAIDVMCELMHHWFGGDPKDEVREIKRELEKLPSVQPLVIHCTDCEDWLERQSILGFTISELPFEQPEIIACGDCKHWICHDKRCGYWNHGVKPLDWCCHAERRTND